MKKLLTLLAIGLATGLLVPTIPAFAKTAAPKNRGKMVSVYQADKCHMYFSAAQAKQYNYACPDSRGKMKMVKVPSAVAAKGLAATNAALVPKPTM